MNRVKLEGINIWMVCQMYTGGPRIIKAAREMMMKRGIMNVEVVLEDSGCYLVFPSVSEAVQFRLIYSESFL